MFRQWLLLIRLKITVICYTFDLPFPPEPTTTATPSPTCNPATTATTVKPNSCDAFFDSPSVRDFRYARNQIQKAERSQNGIASLDKLFGKAATAFHDAATFFKDCSDPRALPLYEDLRFDQIKSSLVHSHLPRNVEAWLHSVATPALFMA